MVRFVLLFVTLAGPIVGRRFLVGFLMFRLLFLLQSFLLLVLFFLQLLHLLLLPLIDLLLALMILLLLSALLLLNLLLLQLLVLLILLLFKLLNLLLMLLFELRVHVVIDACSGRTVVVVTLVRLWLIRVDGARPVYVVVLGIPCVR